MNGVLSSIYVSFFVGMLLVSCGGTSEKKKEVPAQAEAVAQKKNEVTYVKGIKLISPKSNLYDFNEIIEISFEVKDKYSVDSTQYFVNGQRIGSTGKDVTKYSFPLSKERAGKQTLKVLVFHPENRRSTAIETLAVKPDKAPKRLSYEIVNTYTHDKGAYTQGLVWENGHLYEGTGRNGASGIRKYKPEDGRILQSREIDYEYFGEGIALSGGKIYQLTWESKKGFIYDQETFELLGEFSYNTEGWGLTLTADGKHFIMSDGTENLYYRAGDNIALVEKTIEVYDNNGAVKSLNELELIDGYVWANVWQTDRIVLINPESGAIEGELDMSKLLSSKERQSLEEHDEVLNGIAYNPKKKTVFVTGKHWPKLFELKIIWK